MVRGKMSLMATTIVLAGLGITAGANAAFPPLKVLPPPQQNTGTQKEVDPPQKCDCPTPQQTPEPGTLALTVIGAGAVAAWKRRRSAKNS